MKRSNTRTVTPCFIKPSSAEGIRETGSLVGEGLGAHVSCEASLVRIQPSPPVLMDTEYALLRQVEGAAVGSLRQKLLFICTSRVEESQDLFTKVFAEKCT